MTIPEQLKKQGRKEGIQQGRQEGREEGIQQSLQRLKQEKLQIAENFLREGLTEDIVARATQLPLKDILALKQQLEAKKQ